MCREKLDGRTTLAAIYGLRTIGSYHESGYPSRTGVRAEADRSRRSGERPSMVGNLRLCSYFLMSCVREVASRCWIIGDR